MSSTASTDNIAQRLGQVRQIILVVSGKGGVGKSTVSAQLAVALARSGLKVGLLDVDLCGPSIPRMMGLEAHSVLSSDSGWQPVFVDKEERLGVISIQFLLPNKDDAVVWRGPKKQSTIRAFLGDVNWGALDALVIDTPPGTSDEHLTLAELLLPLAGPALGAVVVGSPQGVALIDVKKEISFCRKQNIHVLGFFENMSGFVCPHCTECTNVFSTGGGEAMAAELAVPFLGRIPLDPALSHAIETGATVDDKFPRGAASMAAVAQFAEDIAAKLKPPPTPPHHE